MTTAIDYEDYEAIAAWKRYEDHDEALADALADYEPDEPTEHITEHDLEPWHDDDGADLAYEHGGGHL